MAAERGKKVLKKNLHFYNLGRFSLCRTVKSQQAIWNHKKTLARPFLSLWTIKCTECDNSMPGNYFFPAPAEKSFKALLLPLEAQSRQRQN